MMCRKNEEPLSLLQATRAHQASSSKCNTVLWWNQTKTGSNALIPKRTSTIKRHSYLLPMQSVCKNITSEIMNCYSCIKHRREIKKIFTWSSLYNISDSHYIQDEQDQSNLLNLLKHFFSTYLYVPQLLTAEEALKFLHIIRRERCFIQGSQ